MFQSSSLKSVCLVFRPPGGAAMFCTRAKSFPGGEASEAHFYSGIHYFSKGNNDRVNTLRKEASFLLQQYTELCQILCFVQTKVKVNI